MKDINLLQIKFRYLLETYMSGGIMNNTYQKYYPFKEGVDIQNINKDLKILCNASDIEIDEINFKSEEVFANTLSQIYLCLFAGLCTSNKTKKQYIDLEKYKPNSRLDEIEKFLQNKNILKYASLVAVQGSYASNDFLYNISDLDAFLILKTETLSSGKKIYQLKKILYESMYYFYNIDPHQHHGYFIFTPYDLEHYPEIFLPLSVLNKSKSLCGDTYFHIQKRNCEEESINSYKGVSKYLREYSLEDFQRIHDFKLYFQVIQLLPISILQTKGIFINKKDSFDKLKQVSNIRHDVFDYCYELRLKWHVKAFRNSLLTDLMFHALKNPKITYYMNQIIYRETPKDYKIFAKEYLNRDKIDTILKQADNFIYGRESNYH